VFADDALQLVLPADGLAVESVPLQERPPLADLASSTAQTSMRRLP
jgi:hypothetical protein